LGAVNFCIPAAVSSSAAMEELQDAIEDAQYVNAIATQEEGPRPVLAWEIPTEEQLAAWESKIKETSKDDSSGPEPFGIDWCLQSAIGLFIFSSFLKEDCDDYLRINFIEEVGRWRKMKGKHRLDRAKKIVEVYLKPLPIDDVTGDQVNPEKTQIDEYDLVRDTPQTPMTADEFKTMYSQSIDESKSRNCLGMCGPILEDLFAKIKEVEKTLIAQKRTSSSELDTSPELKESGDAREAPSSPLRRQQVKEKSMKQLRRSLKEGDSDIPGDLFEKVDMVVVEDLRRQYWDSFIESKHYTKLKNFLWFQDRPVVPDDFFTMRVLGRGGFGSVIGKVRKGAMWFLSQILIRQQRGCSLAFALLSLQKRNFWQIVCYESNEQKENQIEEVRATGIK
jgi:hypothetical protein